MDTGKVKVNVQRINTNRISPFNKIAISRYSVVTVLLCLFSMQFVSAADAPSYYFITGEFGHAKLELRVNDIPVFKDAASDIAVVTVPVNHALISQKNTIKISLSPDKSGKFRSESTVQLHITRAASTDGRTNKKIIRTLDLKNLSDKNTKADSSFILNRNGKSLDVTTELDLGKVFPTWGWQEGVTIKTSKENFESLLAEYRSIHALLDKKDSKALEKKLALKIDDFQKYNFIKSAEDAKKKVTYNELFNEPSNKLIPLWEKNMNLQVFANGKLARIADPDGDSPIVFLMGEKGGTAFVVKLIFMKDKSGNWKVVR